MAVRRWSKMAEPFGFSESALIAYCAASAASDFIDWFNHAADKFNQSKLSFLDISFWFSSDLV